jgi:hypothetical protein
MGSASAGRNFSRRSATSLRSILDSLRNRLAFAPLSETNLAQNFSSMRFRMTQAIRSASSLSTRATDRTNLEFNGGLSAHSGSLRYPDTGWSMAAITIKSRHVVGPWPDPTVQCVFAALKKVMERVYCEPLLAVTG